MGRQESERRVARRSVPPASRLSLPAPTWVIGPGAKQPARRNSPGRRSAWLAAREVERERAVDVGAPLQDPEPLVPLGPALEHVSVEPKRRPKDRGDRLELRANQLLVRAAGIGDH